MEHALNITQMISAGLEAAKSIIKKVAFDVGFRILVGLDVFFCGLMINMIAIPFGFGVFFRQI